MKGKTLVTYLSMGFGNPYDEAYSPELIAEFVEKLSQLDIKIISIADTIGKADSALIQKLFEVQTQSFPDIEFGAHLHSTAAGTKEKVIAALKGGCKRFDGALNGYGGCPFAENELVGNVATEILIDTLEDEGHELTLNKQELKEALKLTDFVFF